MAAALAICERHDGRRFGGGDTRRRWLLLGALCAGVVALVAAALVVGQRAIPLSVIVEALADPDRTVNDHIVVRELRLPRALIGVAAGAGLGMAGAVIQALTRNPIADPGLLGVNAGASLAVVVGISWFGVASAAGYALFAVVGAALAAVMVFAIGARGPVDEVPVRLVLVGAALTAGATSLISLVILRETATLDRFRFWVVGSLAGRDGDLLVGIAPLLLVGAVLALAGGAALNALSLGDDIARSLGSHPGRTRLMAGAAAVLLCAGATALVGPIVFVGLAVPHIARRLGGPDWRWIVALSAPLGALLLLAADIVGRVIAPPGELEAGIVAAFLGAPLLIAMVRRGRVVAA